MRSGEGLVGGGALRPAGSDLAPCFFALRAVLSSVHAPCLQVLQELLQVQEEGLHQVRQEVSGGASEEGLVAHDGQDLFCHTTHRCSCLPADLHRNCHLTPLSRYTDGKKQIEAELEQLKKHSVVIRVLAHTQVG